MVAYYDKENLMDEIVKISANIKEKKFAPVYFLYGKEEFVIDKLEKGIRKNFTDNTGLNVKVYDDDSFNYDEVEHHIIASPFMNEKKLIIFKNVSIFRKKSKSDENKAALDEKKEKSKNRDELLIDKMSANTDINIILIIENETEKKYDDYYKATNPYIAFAKENGVLLKADKLDDYDIAKYVMAHISKEGCEIDRVDTAFLINNCGKNIINLFNEADKLIAYVGDRKKITKADIIECTSRNLEESIYKLIELFTANRKNEALKLYGDLLSEGIKEYYIFLVFASNYEKLMIIKDLIDRGKGLKEIVEITKMKDWQVKQLMTQSKLFTKDALSKKLDKVTKLNYEYMKGNLNDSLMTELLFY